MALPPQIFFDLPGDAMTDFRNRDQLHRSAVEALGEEEADTLMSSLPPMDWSDLATKYELKAEIARLEERMDLRFESLEHKLTATFESSLRKQTQWVFGAVVVLAISMVAGIAITALAAG